MAFALSASMLAGSPSGAACRRAHFGTAGSWSKTHSTPASRTPSEASACFGCLAAVIAIRLVRDRGWGERRRRGDRQRRHVVPNAAQHLIGEELVTDDDSASKLADRCVEEAQRIVNSTAGWTRKLEEDGVVVEVCPVAGPYGQSGVDLVRSSSVFACSADEFMDFQTSKLGFAATDEYLQNHGNVASYAWAGRPSSEPDGPSLMLNRVEWPYPLKTREFVSLDLIDRDNNTFVSKSCLHPDRPGGSKYQNIVKLDERDYVRAVQYYCVVVEPLSEDRCLVKMATWGEMCDGYSAFWVNEFNARLFIIPKFNRLRKCIALTQDGGDVEEFISRECSRDIAQVAWDLLRVAPWLRSTALRSTMDYGSDFVKMMLGQRAQRPARQRTT